jgi:hypothetical protein
MRQLFSNPEQSATTDPVYLIIWQAYLGPRRQPTEDPVMLNREALQNRFLPSLVAALAVSILVVMASLTHNVVALAAHV